MAPPRSRRPPHDKHRSLFESPPYSGSCRHRSRRRSGCQRRLCQGLGLPERGAERSQQRQQQGDDGSMRLLHGSFFRSSSVPITGLAGTVPTGFFLLLHFPDPQQGRFSGDRQTGAGHSPCWSLATLPNVARSVTPHWRDRGDPARTFPRLCGTSTLPPAVSRHPA